MAKISIEVGQGDDDYTVMRDGEVFALRQGESIVLVGEDMMLVDGGGSPITVMHFLYPEEEDDIGELKEAA